MKTILVQLFSAVSQPHGFSSTSHCPLISTGADADRQLLLWTETSEQGLESVWTEHKKHAHISLSMRIPRNRCCYIHCFVRSMTKL